MVAVKNISWSASNGEEGLQEMITFEYGGLIVTTNQQGTDGRISNVLNGGWNRVKNVRDVDLNAVIQ